MPDPVATAVTSGSSGLASVTVNFAAQPAGTFLLLCTAGDAYKSGDPSGWPTLAPEVQTFHGLNLWRRIATGSETSVTYTLGSAAQSAYVLVAVSNVDTTTPVDGTPATQFAQASATSYTTPTATTSAGRRIALGVIGMSHGTNLITGLASWLNSYTEVVDGETTVAPGLVVGVASLVLDGGGTTSTGATVENPGTVTPQARSGAIVVLREAAAADTTPPSIPANLRTTAVGATTADLAWDASTDNVGVTGYEVVVTGPL